MTAADHVEVFGKSMVCNCDLAWGKPFADTGHTPDCRLHRIAMAAVASGARSEVRGQLTGSFR
jgi:hypothetical protein